MAHVIHDVETIRILYTKAELEALILQELVDAGDLPELPDSIHIHPHSGEGVDYVLIAHIDMLPPAP
jgi:hypothetical protein